MNKVLQLKIASMILFWFGVLLQLYTVIVVQHEYSQYGYSPFLTPEESGALTYDNVLGFAYYGFIHIMHLIAGYLIAKGTKKGIVMGILVGSLEIGGAFSPSSFYYISTPEWIVIRILFVIVIVLIISGRKDLAILQSENWRPWKNPKTISTQ